MKEWLREWVYNLLLLSAVYTCANLTAYFGGYRIELVPRGFDLERAVAEWREGGRP